MTPQVSIGMPVYNGEDFITRALDSLLAQTYEDFEIVISDNASTDRTEEICLGYANRDSRIRYYRQPRNFGAARNYNDTVALARGRYFKWMAHDDMIHPRYLQVCLEGFNSSSSSVVLVFPKSCWIDVNDELINYYGLPIKWDGASPRSRFGSLLRDRKHSYLRHPHPIFGLMCIKTLRQTRMIQPFQGADLVALVELGLRGDFLEIPEYLSYWRKHKNSSMVNKTRKEKARWYDPQRRPLLVTSRINIFVEYRRSLAQSDLSNKEKLVCLLILIKAAGVSSHIFAEDIILGVREMLFQR